MTPDLDPIVQIKLNFPQAEATIRRFLYYAIYRPPGSSPADHAIIDQPELKRYYQNWGRKGDYAVFAVIDDNVIGVSWVRLFPADTPGYGTITPEIPELSIAVLPDYRGRGIGSRLLDAILTCIRSKFEAVSLSVSAGNPALRLYERFGFSVYSRNDTTFLMRKRLDSIAPHSNRG